MEPVIKDIREISDSKEMYESKPHPFLSIFIYILLGCILIAGIWTYFGEIDIVSKGIGVVRPNDNISKVRSKAQGEVLTSNLEEGKKVKKGDVLFTIAHDDQIVKRLQVEEVLEETEHNLKQLKKLKDSIEQDKNLFSPTEEKEYFDRYLKYKQDYEELKNQVFISSKNEIISTTQTEISRASYEDKISEYSKKLKQLEDFRKSVRAEKNVFEDKNCTDALVFNNYLFKLYELRKDIENKKMLYDLNIQLDEAGLAAGKELEDSKVAMEAAQNELKKLQTATMKEIEDQIKELTSSKQMALHEINKLIIDRELLSTNEEQRGLSIQQYKTDTLVALYSQIEELDIAYKSKKRELESIDLSIKDCTITASIDGTINILQEINKGDLISAGTDVATIIPTNDSLYKIEIFMPNREIAGIKAGDMIKYKFEALPYKEYGQLTGHIINISTDARVNNNQGVSGYYVQGSIENKTIYSYKNEPAEIKVGMTCEAHVVTEQKKILYYLLEKINLVD